MTSQHASKRQRITASSKANAAEIEDFPCWAKGTVWIEVSQDPTHQYQLHKAVLERNSVWFAAELAKMIFDPGVRRKGHLKDTIRYFFRPKLAADAEKPILRRVPLSVGDLVMSTMQSQRRGVAPTTADASFERVYQGWGIFGYEHTVTTKSETGILKVESANESSSHDEPPTVLTASERLRRQDLHQQYLAAYNNLFLMYYNRAPSVSITSINAALIQCEAILSIATFYSSLSVVRPYLGNILSQFRHALFAAIAEDPPRWFNLSIPLESGSIFSEALIHLAGCWPSCAWPTPVTTIASDMTELIKTKSKRLGDLRGEVDRELLTNSLCAEGGDPVSLASSPESWMVAQVFRDWLATQMHRICKGGLPHYGAMYRLVRKGGEAYLPLDTVSGALDGIRGQDMGRWVEITEDLHAMKEFAMRAVEPLVGNCLMLDVEAAGIKYLTCVDVGMEDFPWVEGMADGGGE